MTQTAVKQSRASRSTAPFWLLCAAAVLLAVISWLRITVDTALAPPSDSAHHLLNTIFYSRTLDQWGLDAYWQTVRSTYVGWPPASYALLYGPLGMLFGDDPYRMRLYGVVLLPLLLWGTYRIGRPRFGAPAAALAGLLVIYSFGISGQLRQVSIDLPATTAVLIALLALLKTQQFQSVKWAALFGSAMGLCLLTRVQSLFFLAGPGVVYGLTALLRAPDGRTRLTRMARIALALGLAALVSSPWWFGRLGALAHVSSAHLDPSRINPRGDPGFWAGLWYYGRAAGQIAGWTVLGSALAGVVLLWRGKGSRRRTATDRVEAAVLASSVVGGLLGCVLGVHRESRYLLPAIPPLALLAVWGLARLQRPARSALGVVLLLTVICPTLWAVAQPFSRRHPAVRAGLVDWVHARKPLRVNPPQAASQAAAAIVRAHGTDVGGRDVYVLLLQDSRYNLLPRVMIYLTSHFPKLAFSSLVNTEQANLRWHMGARQRRALFVLAGVDHKLNLPQIWSSGVRRFRTRVPIRLYRVPRPHPLRGPVSRAAAARLKVQP